MNAIKRRLLSFLVIFLLIVGGMIGSVIHKHRRYSSLIAVGAKNSTEGHLLAEILSQCIEETTSLKVKRQFQLDGTFIAFHALKTGAIDLYIEYTGTAYIALLKESSAPSHWLDALKDECQKKYHVLWMPSLGFSCAYVLAVHTDFAKENGVYTLSDLSRFQSQSRSCTFAFDAEFAARPEIKLIEKGYELSFRMRQLLDHTLLFLELERRSFDVINAYETDGFLANDQMRILQDDLHCLPAYDAAPVIREKTLREHPELKKIFTSVAGKITKEKMIGMNYKVEKKGKSVHDVAKQFLINESIISSH